MRGRGAQLQSLYLCQPLSHLGVCGKAAWVEGGLPVWSPLCLCSQGCWGSSLVGTCTADTVGTGWHYWGGGLKDTGPGALAVGTAQSGVPGTPDTIPGLCSRA